MDSPLVAAPPAEAPTRVRYLVVALCFAMAVLLYIDRFALTPITTETGAAIYR